MLDWKRIPETPTVPVPASHPFAQDLDLLGTRSVHQLLDVSASAEGSRLLEDWLTEPIPDPALVDNRQQAVRELVGLSRFRDKFLLALRLHSEGRLEGKKLRKWLQSDTEFTRLRTDLSIASLLVFFNYLLIIGYLVGWFRLPYWEFSLLVYFAFHLSCARRVWPLLNAAVSIDDQLSSLARVVRFLEKYPCQGHPHLARLCSVFQNLDARPSRYLHRVKLLTVLAGLRMNPILGMALNLLVPWDFLAVYFIARSKEQLKEHVPAWLDRCSELEALASLANFGYLNPDYCFPTLKELSEGERKLEACHLGHPLIERQTRVSNDFSLGTDQVVVLTGSNMSGKSTFIKSLGVNLALAQAGAPVCASRLSANPFRLFACIRLVDSVQDHVSTFYAEVRRLRQLLEALQQPHTFPLFFLIDEIFRGTNNRERLLGSKSFLEALLGKNGAGVITTHDLELAVSADRMEGVRNYHFREEIVDDRMVFDYHLREGICPTTNALKIMRMEGLPTPE